MNKRGNVRVEVQTYNQARHLNKLLTQGVKLEEVSKEEKNLRFTVPARDFPKVKGYFQEVGVRIEKTRLAGLGAAKQRLMGRVFLCISVLLFLGLILASTRFIFFVKVTGAQKVDKAFVLEVVRSAGGRTPLWKDSIDTSAIKNAVTGIEGVAIASVYVKGCVLHVGVNEELEAQDLVPVSYLPLVAAEDCIVERVICEQGTALVKEGDVVLAGQTLIAPYILTGQEGQTSPSPAKGEVRARVFRTAEERYYGTRVVEKQTGGRSVSREISLNDKSLALGKESPYATYLTDVLEWTLYPIPLKITEKTYIEVVTEEVNIPFESVKESIEQELYAKILIECKNNMQITNKWCIIKDNVGYYTLTCVVETLEVVSQRGSG